MDNEEEPKPTLKEVKDWILCTIRHSVMVEYYLYKLGLDVDSQDRPHDIVGEGNKLSWQVIKGLAMQFRSDDSEFFLNHVRPSIQLHRQQEHHQKWNLPHNMDEAYLRMGAVDAICSLLEYRKYQGGSHTFEEIPEIIKKNEKERMKVLWLLKPQRERWMWEMYEKMKKIPVPDIKRIKSIYEIPNIGIPEDVHKKIKKRVKDTIRMLRQRGYDV